MIVVAIAIAIAKKKKKKNTVYRVSPTVWGNTPASLSCLHVVLFPCVCWRACMSRAAARVSSVPTYVCTYVRTCMCVRVYESGLRSASRAEATSDIETKRRLRRRRRWTRAARYIRHTDRKRYGGGNTRVHDVRTHVRTPRSLSLTHSLVLFLSLLPALERAHHARSLARSLTRLHRSERQHREQHREVFPRTREHDTSFADGAPRTEF